MSSVYRSEHRTRYRREPHIRILRWNKEAIKYFLQEKVNRLDGKFFIGSKHDKTIVSWLGIRKIHNNARDCDEPIEDYLVRHTRLLPRDIVILGNSLCNTIERAKNRNDLDSIEIHIRNAVSEEAKIFGEEQLIICGHQIASDQIPISAALHGYSDTYTGNKEYIRGIADELKQIIKYIGKDHFTIEELKEGREFASKFFGKESDPFSILWQNGLMGYIKNNCPKNEEKIIFKSEESTEFAISLEESTYVFHSCLIDCVGIEPIGLPVLY